MGKIRTRGCPIRPFTRPTESAAPDDRETEVGPSCEAEREADARAQVLIYLLEHHLLALQ
jgi:hypothetical protein